MSQSVPPPVPPAAAPRGSTWKKKKPARLSIAAFICGLLGFIPLLGLIGIVLAIIALANKKQGKKGLAIAGLILGIALPITSMVILHGYADRARTLAKQAMSQVKLNVMGKAVALYGAENEDAYPPSPDVLIESGEISEEMLHYPGMEGGPREYFYHPPVVPEGDLPDGNMILACEVRDFTEGSRAALFASGGVSSISEAEFQQMLDAPINAEFAKAYRAAGHN